MRKLPDTEAPVINHTPASQSEIGQPVPIQATITDNKSVASATISYDGNDVPMSKSGDEYSAVIAAQTELITLVYTIEAQNELGTLIYTIEATDTSGNTAIETYSTEIVDTQSPSISHVQPVNEVYVGTAILISAEATDNVGISEVRIYYNDVNNQDHNVVMTDAGGVYSSQMPAQGDVGGVTYYMQATDTSGNFSSTTTYSINVVEIPDTTPPQIQHTTNEAKVSDSDIQECRCSDGIYLIRVVDTQSKRTLAKGKLWIIKRK